MVQEASYGIIPLRKVSGEWHVLVVQHGAGHWSFPKGHPERNESDLEAANRELYEETGLTVRKFLSESTFTEEYFFSVHGKRIHKTVVYFIAEVEGHLAIQTDELRAAKWVPLHDCVANVTFPAAKNICKKLLDFMKQYQNK